MSLACSALSFFFFVLLFFFIYLLLFFFFNDTATTEIYTLSLHDALPIGDSQLTQASPWLPPESPTPRTRKQAPSSAIAIPRAPLAEPLICAATAAMAANTSPQLISARPNAI